MNKKQAIKLLNIYREAWVKKDPELILTIFTLDATYNDPREPENYGHEGIRAYWISKVVEGQRDIHFKLLNTWIEGETVIAEWEAQFVDIKRNLKIDMTEVAVFTTQGDKFSAVREYYKTLKTPL